MPETSPNRATGRLYVFEGIDGSGKTTQVRLTSANLTSKGIEHAIVEMPGSSRISVEIREILNRLRSSEVSATTEALLHLAMIRNGLEKHILPALASGRNVLMDRSHLSTAAYQGAFDDDLHQTIIDSADTWLSSLRPDMVFYFDLDAKVAAERIRLRGGDPDKYDGLPLDVKDRVRSRYLSMQARLHDRFKVIDASGGVAEISAELMDLIQEDMAIHHQSALGGPE